MISTPIFNTYSYPVRKERRENGKLMKINLEIHKRTPRRKLCHFPVLISRSYLISSWRIPFLFHPSKKALKRKELLNSESDLGESWIPPPWEIIFPPRPLKRRLTLSSVTLCFPNFRPVLSQVSLSLAPIRITFIIKHCFFAFLRRRNLRRWRSSGTVNQPGNYDGMSCLCKPVYNDGEC